MISDSRSEEARKAVVPGSGPAGALIAFIAASPSELEGIRRLPFVGQAGRVFKEHYLDPLGLTRDQVILAHVVPEVLKSDGRIRGPSQAEIDAHLPSLLKALDDSKPQVIIALGRVAKDALGDRAALVLPHPLAIISKGDRGEVARKLKQIKGLVQKERSGSAQPFHRIIKGYCTLHNSKGGTFVVNAPGLDCKGSDKSSNVSSASGVPGSDHSIIPSGRPNVIRLWLRSHPDERAVVRSIKNGKAEVRLAGSGDLLGTFSTKDLPEGLAEGDRLYPVSSGLVIIKPRSDNIKRHTHEAYHTPEENALNHEPRLEDDTTSWLAREMSPEAKVSVTHIDSQTKEAILTSEARSWQARIPLNLLPDPQEGDVIYGTSGKLNNKRTGESTDSAPLIDYILHNTEAPSYFKNLIKPYGESGPDISGVTKSLEEDEPHSAVALQSYYQNWQTYVPKTGKGRFVLQAHWRGLNREEANLSHEELLKTDNNVHCDLRLEIDGETLWGFTIFEGKASDIRETTDGAGILSLKPADSLQGAYKLPQPYAWLDIAKEKPYVIEPTSAGATSKSWAAFFQLDAGEYELSYAREYARELFMHGAKLKGRLLIQCAPVGSRRVWIINRPEDQTPYTANHKLEDVEADVKARGQKYLVWADKPGESPQVINTSSDIQKGQGYATILKADEEKRIVCGVVLEPESFDLQGHRLTADEIKRSGEEYLKKSRVFFDRHRKPAKAELVKFWFVDKDQMVYGQLVKANSWVICVHVSDDRIWDRIKRGEYTGFSVGGRGVLIPVRIA